MGFIVSHLKTNPSKNGVFVYVEHIIHVFVTKNPVEVYKHKHNAFCNT